MAPCQCDTGAIGVLFLRAVLANYHCMADVFYFVLWYVMIVHDTERVRSLHYLFLWPLGSFSDSLAESA